MQSVGEICYTELSSLGDFDKVKWHDCTLRELLYMQQTWKVTKRTLGRRYTIIKVNFYAFTIEFIGHACTSWHFCHEQKYSKCLQTC